MPHEVKILFLNYEYPPLGGGAANATRYIFQEFSRMEDLQVEMVTSAVGKNYSREKIGENIVIHRLPIGKNHENLHFQSQKDLLVYSWKAFFFCQKLLREKEFDLSHSFFTVPCGFLSYRFRKKFDLPYIISLRGADVPGYSERFSLIYGLLTPLIVRIWKRSASTIANSQGLKELALLSAPEQEIGVIYNGVDTEEFRPGEDWMSKYDQKTFRIVCVSRLTQRKGIDYLIAAIRILKERGRAVELVLAGEGNDKENLEELSQKSGLSENVRFLGRLPHEKVAEIYASSQAFCLPSLNEGMSNTLLEALSSGLPLIATDTGGTKELLSDGENGYLIKMKDAHDIAEKIDKMIDDPGLSREMARKSREKAEEMSWKKVAEDYRELYKKILDPSR